MLSRLLLCTLILLEAASARAAGLRDAFEAALLLNPEIKTIEAQRAVIDARTRGANALLPGPPSAGVGYATDRFTQNRGFQEAEIEANVPIWLPGQATAQRGLAEAEGRRLSARITAQRLVVAGQVREAYWTWVAAEAALAAARTRSSASIALARDVARQSRGGQVSRAEELLAGADARETEAGLREAEVAVREARLAFRTLTGRDPVAGWQEVAWQGAQLPEHPAVQAARLGIEVARADQRIAVVEDRESPEIGVFTRQERDDRDTGWDTRIGVRLRIPFAHPPRNAERRALAQGEMTSATATAASAERRIAAERENARAALADARDTARVAEQRFGALSQAASLGERAQREGQTGLGETLRLRASAAAADADRRRAQVALRRAVSRYNQSVGVEP